MLPPRLVKPRMQVAQKLDRDWKPFRFTVSHERFPLGFPHDAQVIAGIADSLFACERALIEDAEGAFGARIHCVCWEVFRIAMPKIAVELIGGVGGGIEAVYPYTTLAEDF